MDEYQWDVFISHASEDKADVVLPIAQQLQESGFKVWLDQHELKPGYSLREQIDNGLAHSRFGIIIISNAFMQKPWPRTEMNAIISRDIAGRIRLIPVWHEVTFNDVTQFSPILADRFALHTSEEIHYVVNDLIRAILREKTESLTMTRMFLNILGENPNSRRVTDFLLAHSSILGYALKGNPYLCSARKALDLNNNLSEMDDFILGVVTPGTESVWIIRSVFLIPTDYPICTSNGQEIPELQRCSQLMIQHVSTLEPAELTETILSQHSLSKKQLDSLSISSNYNLARPLVITRRRADLNPEELVLINRTNQDRKMRIRTFDWLIDSCRILDYGSF